MDSAATRRPGCGSGSAGPGLVRVVSIAPKSWNWVALNGKSACWGAGARSHLLTRTAAVNSSSCPVRVSFQSGWKAPGVAASA